MTGPRNKETPWKSAATLEAELRRERVARVRAEEALRQVIAARTLATAQAVAAAAVPEKAKP